ncbi:hypothetical protein M422DRAFT_247731 [Sphaerobolus stellatus SS14]|nr:hypothetical protein M422DRAFT_247731 [Sphaerobolus stellatus SS14]
MQFEADKKIMLDFRGMRRLWGCFCLLLVCHLLNNPNAYAKVRTEVDTVFRPPHILFIRIALNSRPTQNAPSDAFHPNLQDVGVQVFVMRLHKDTSVWGEDVEVFRPERMLNGGFERAPVRSSAPTPSALINPASRSLHWNTSTQRNDP